MVRWLGGFLGLVLLMGAMGPMAGSGAGATADRFALPPAWEIRTVLEMPDEVLPVIKFSGGDPIVTDERVLNAGYENGTFACVLWAHDAAGTMVTSPTEVPDCYVPRPLAHVPTMDLLILCANEVDGSPLVFGLDGTTFETRWTVTVGDDLGSPAEGPLSWLCTGGAADLDRGVFYGVAAGFTGGGAQDSIQGRGPNNNRVFALDIASGDVLWTHALQDNVFLGNGLVDPFDDRGQRMKFQPLHVSLTSTGLLVSGHYYCYVNAVGCDNLETGDPADPNRGYIAQMGYAWFTLEGDLRGAALAQNGFGTTDDRLDSASRRPSGNLGAAVTGHLATFGLGGEVALIDPAEGQPLLRAPLETHETVPEFVTLVQPLATDQYAVLPLLHSVTALSTLDLQHQWAWSDDNRHFIETLARSGDDVLLVVSGPWDSWGVGEVPVDLVRIDGATGQEIDRSPLYPLRGPEIYPAHNHRFAPTGARTAMIWDNTGTTQVLGPPSDPTGDRIQLEPQRPGPGEVLTLGLIWPGDATNATVDWGDGDHDRYQRGETPTHTYELHGDRALAVTFHHPDGTTTTSTTVVAVGAEDLNALQTAFAPENQDLTFGVLGIFLTLLGALIATTRNRRRRSRLEEELDRLSAIRAHGMADPNAALLEVDAYRSKLPQKLGAGDIDDAQFSVLEVRAGRLMTTLRQRILAPYEGRLSDRYRRLLEVALDDGLISAPEARRLEEGLDAEEGLSDPERSELTTLIQEWQRQADGAAGPS